MKKVLFFSAVALSAIMMVSCNKPAAQTEEKEAIEQAASQEMDAIRTALALAQYGYAAESPAALIEAADILASTPVQPVAVEGEVGAQNENEGEKAAKAEVTVEQLLADARALTEDAKLLRLLKAQRQLVVLTVVRSINVTAFTLTATFSTFRLSMQTKSLRYL